MKRTICIAILAFLGASLAAQDHWRVSYDQARDFDQRADVVTRMDEAGATGDVWVAVLHNLYAQWSSFRTYSERITAEESLRTALKNVRNQELTGGSRIVYEIARQAQTPKLKAEAILTIGHLRYEFALRWLADHIWYLSQEPGTNALDDEIVAAAGVAALRMFRTPEARAALTAGSSKESWFPRYIREAAQLGLQELPPISEGESADTVEDLYMHEEQADSD